VAGLTWRYVASISLQVAGLTWRYAASISLQVAGLTWRYAAETVRANSSSFDVEEREY